MSRIAEVEVVEFSFEARNLGRSAENLQAIYNIGYSPNSSLTLTKFAIVIRTCHGRKSSHCAMSSRTSIIDCDPN